MKNDFPPRFRYGSAMNVRVPEFCLMNRGPHASLSSVRLHLSALDPHPRNVKNCRRENQHLQNWNKADICAGNDGHAGAIFPALQEVHGDPFNRKRDNQSAAQHHAIALESWIDEPVPPPESDPSDRVDDPENDAVPQARDETMFPNVFPAVNAGIQRALSDFPHIVQCNGDGKYRCEVPKRIDAIGLGSQRHYLLKWIQKWKLKEFLYSVTLA